MPSVQQSAAHGTNIGLEIAKNTVDASFPGMVYIRG